MPTHDRARLGKTGLMRIFLQYKNRYNLSTGFKYFDDEINTRAAYNLRWDTIKFYMGLREDDSCSVWYLLHEIGHAVQNKKNHIAENYLVMNFELIWNLELGAEKFARREYYRNFYKTFGPPMIDAISPKDYARGYNKKVSDKRLRRLQRKTDGVYA